MHGRLNSKILANIYGDTCDCVKYSLQLIGMLNPVLNWYTYSSKLFTRTLARKASVLVLFA